MHRGILAAALILAVLPAYGQQSSSEIRVVVGVPLSRPDSESVRQLNLNEAQRRVWAAAIEQLRMRPDVQALKLSAVQFTALVAVLVVPEDVSPPTVPSSGQVTLRVQLDAPGVARRMIGLRGDPDAFSAVLAAWTQMQALYDRITAQTTQRAAATGADAARLTSELQQTFKELTVRHLTARATAAMARTELATVGGRVPSADGRERAGRLFEEARAVLPDSHHVHLLTGDMLLDAEQPEAAEEWYRKALVGNEGSAAAHLKLAEVLRLQGKFDAAILEIREAMKVVPTSAAAHTDLALILRQQGKDDEGIAEYREAIRLDRDWADAHNGLAVALAGRGRTEEAVVEFREIVRIDPDSTIGHYNLATALANLDRDGEAAAALREVIRIYPDHYNARFNLGEMFRLEGKFDESAKQFREYVRLAPDTPQNQRNLKRARSYIQQFEN